MVGYEELMAISKKVKTNDGASITAKTSEDDHWNHGEYKRGEAPAIAEQKPIGRFNMGLPQPKFQSGNIYGKGR